MRHQRNDITVAVTPDGDMYIAQGQPAYDAMDRLLGSDFECSEDLYYSQVYHRCAALTPDGWAVCTPSEAKRNGWRWVRYPARFGTATGTPVHVGQA